MTNDWAMSLAEPCLLSGIVGDLILGITSKTVELRHILVNGHLSLSQIAELFLLALHQLTTLERHHGTPSKSLRDHIVALQHSSPTIEEQHLPESMPQK